MTGARLSSSSRKLATVRLLLAVRERMVLFSCDEGKSSCLAWSGKRGGKAGCEACCASTPSAFFDFGGTFVMCSAIWFGSQRWRFNGLNLDEWKYCSHACICGKSPM
jgi:hypothetical protein